MSHYLNSKFSIKISLWIYYKSSSIRSYLASVKLKEQFVLTFNSFKSIYKIIFDQLKARILKNSKCFWKLTILCLKFSSRCSDTEYYLIFEDWWYILRDMSIKNIKIAKNGFKNSDICLRDIDLVAILFLPLFKCNVCASTRAIF